ncbi:DUF1998 domain-containing protein [Dyella solisilvae]|uniref:DUF1998 domain-containing protein n=1 Tax=Dyella solisilvae TaxID=1920168 RepID=A0A370K8J3_9GAMM|nr:DEAD/DEAH box helicase [Dyella solisilvae]RDI98959.1 DUF1998 domain-containing protein [Dyella solisilvae]
MLPSILAHEIRESTSRFLITAYEPSDTFFGGVMQRFVEGLDGIGKGPYLQAGLPFRMGVEGTAFFDGFTLPYPGYSHQESAWRRLASDRGAANTLVATGTGSGKTECFLYPLLDHCVRTRAAGQVKGIKALVIYPMNALATDQARRFAEVIAATPEFKDLRVGLYVGGAKGKPGTGASMTATTVITDRDSLRKAPPDILLTNYKMLDYLLIRPKDRPLWAHNQPNTLRYAVVDELHTFDGAQGTDLAMLLRRLRARLNTPDGYLICAGTSATLGDGDTLPLRDYARQIFASEFSDASVITESRESVADFLGDATIEHVLQGRDDIGATLDAARYRSQEAAIEAWFALFFSGLPLPTNVRDAAWRGELGALLKRHLLVHNLLRVLKGGIGEWPLLKEQLTGPMPAVARPHAERVLDALVALLAWARDPANPRRPLVTLRVQLWMRELRRLVANVRREGGQVALRSAADLKAAPEGIRLPLVQCTECHTTGWLARRPDSATRIDMELEAIYNAWFRSAPEVSRLYPASGLRPQCDARHQYLCGRCGSLQDSDGKCGACGHEEMTAVWEILEQRQTERGGVNFNWHVQVCPACSTRDRLLLLGARNATLGAQLIEQSWATPYNDDKKLIAFSDSVQDAAHRAGFFSSRTYLNNVRMAMTRALQVMAQPTVPWLHYLQQLPALWLDPARSASLTPEEFVTEFIGPNMMWQADWERLQLTGHLPSDGRLLERVSKRLAWQAVAEFTYLSRRGRTLDRLGLATLTLPADALDEMAGSVCDTLREQFGLHSLTSSRVLQWLWGFLIHLRQRGAVSHPEMEHYAREGGLFSFRASQRREDWLPAMGSKAAHPAMLTLGRHPDFDRLVQGQGRSWYQQWLAACLGRDVLLPKRGDEDIYGVAINALLANGVLVAAEGVPGRSLALAADRLYLKSDVVQLRSAQGKRPLTVAVDLAERLQGMPCVDAMQESYAEARPLNGADGWMARRFREGDIRRVIAAEHTGLLEREQREALEVRFKARASTSKPWYENLLSATPTLEMGVDIGDLSSVLLCSVPPTQASYLQRIGRAGRRDGNAVVVTLADGASPHDLYFYEQPLEMMAGEVNPPGVFLQAAEVMRRQLLAFCIDSWVATGIPETSFPDKTGVALDAVEKNELARFPYNLLTYVQQNEMVLLEQFFGLLGGEVQSRVRERLSDYMLGQGDLDGLRIGLLKLLEELARERATLRRRAEEGKRLIQVLRQQPADEATQVQIDELTRERDSALGQAREISARELLGTLTDAGLIPNYAFPEAGVELKSLLWRKRGDGEEGSGAYVTLPAQTYERPASSALSEFAPENRFYANRRRVEIDQVNMDLAKAEQWRLCPACHHMENVDQTGDAHAACPRCGDAMWANVTQKRTLLRFRQAMANANDRYARIDDSSDDREPRFFLRQLLVDFEPDAVEIAWKLESDALAFGFEFIRHANFRDINFGERGKAGESFRVADQESVRPGFKLCRHCGMVQKPPRRNLAGEAGPAQTHVRDCQAYGSDDPKHIIDCLYLYREFASEALRILVPYTRSGLDETVLQSFMASLQLGLKKRFGGKVDHLRITAQEEPGKEGAPRRHYVLLYDSVPGGTGYLHQVLSQDAQTLGEVLKQAYAAIQSCTCNENPEKDGCYRCLYQYRQGRAMAMVSRRSAAAVLGELVGSLDRLERVKSISEIFINPQFDSELESRFVESLRRLSGVEKLPTVRVMQEVVQGKTGYLLEVGAERYWMRTQVDLGLEHGVVAASRPDFLLVPVRPGTSRRPIAVFADGWAYHRECLREDARKRSALVASGRYWVWSVTWDDVAAALSGSVSSEVDVVALHRRADTDALAKHAMARLGITPPPAPENAVASLLRWLAIASNTESSDLGFERQQRLAAILVCRLTVPPNDVEHALAEATLERLAATLPEGMNVAPAGASSALSVDTDGPAVVSVAWPPGYLKGDFSAGYGVVQLHSLRAADAAALKSAWQQWLMLFNQLQVLPNLFLVEDEGIAHGDYADLANRRTVSATDDGDGVWAQTLASTLESMRAGLQFLHAQHVEPPDHVGFEWESDGEVVAEAELVWESAHVVVLMSSQVGQEERWKAQAWKVVLGDDTEWASHVLKMIKE